MKGTQSRSFSMGCAIALMLFLGVFGQAWTKDRFEGWHKTGTDHFTFIYEPKDEVSARELTGFCEEVYGKVGGFFDYYPDHITCVIVGRMDTANGSFTTFPNRLRLYVTSPSGPELGSKTENWLEALLIHELTHYIHMTYDKGFFHVLGEVFGEDLKPMHMVLQPGWMVEGIAVVLETKFTSGGRGRNPFTEVYWKAPILEGNLFSFRQASYPSAYPPRGRIYPAGYIIVSYMLDRFGEDVFTEIHREFVKFPLLGPRAAIKKVTGISAADIYDDMQASLEKRYLPNRQIPDSPKTTPDVTGDYYLPEITENGWFLYRRTLKKYPAIVRFDPETGEESILAETYLTDPESLSFTAEGDKGVFAAPAYDNTGPAGETYISDLYMWENDKVRRITHGANLWHPALSADGVFLAAVQKNGSYSRLVSVEIETGRVRELFSPGTATIHNPRISPEGKKIVFALKQGSCQDVWVFDIQSASARSLYSPDIHGEYYPRFKDTNTIIFSSDREGDLRLYAADIQGAGYRELHRDPVAAYAGEIIGNTLFYSSYSSKGWCVKSVPVAPSMQGRTFTDDDSLSVSSGSAFTGSPMEQKRYIDFPIPLVWAPVPAYLDPLGSHLPTAFGIGIFGYGASYLRRSEWYGYISNGFEVFQPSLYVNASFHINRVGIEYNYNQSYFRSGNDFAQGLQQSLTFSLPIAGSYRLGRTATFALFTGFNHLYSMWDSSQFHMFNWFDFDGFNTFQRLYYFGGGGFILAKPGSSRQLFDPFRFIFTAQISTPLHVVPDTPSGFIVYNHTEVQFPLFFENQFLRLGAKMNYTSSALLGTRNSEPRGLFDDETQPYPGSTVFALDYLISLGVFDQPLPIGYNMFGLNLQGMALGLHGEIITDWDYRVFVLDENLYTGIELIFNIGAGLGSIPAGIGLSIRFDRTFSRPFSAAEDLRPYFFIGLDSFKSSVIGWGADD